MIMGKGKVAVVTGSGQGIGQSHCHRFGTEKGLG